MASWLYCGKCKLQRQHELADSACDEGIRVNLYLCHCGEYRMLALIPVDRVGNLEALEVVKRLKSKLYPVLPRKRGG